MAFVDPILSRRIVTATFLPSNIGAPGSPTLFSFAGDISPDKHITVPSGLGMILINLVTGLLADGLPAPFNAVFATSPVEWLQVLPDGQATATPVLAPDMFVFQRIGDNTITLLDFNSNQSALDEAEMHQFNLVVLYGPNTYGSDPTIVNMPPAIIESAPVASAAR